MPQQSIVSVYDFLSTWFEILVIWRLLLAWHSIHTLTWFDSNFARCSPSLLCRLLSQIQSIDVQTDRFHLLRRRCHRRNNSIKLIFNAPEIKCVQILGDKPFKSVLFTFSAWMTSSCLCVWIEKWFVSTRVSMINWNWSILIFRDSNFELELDLTAVCAYRFA